MKSGSSHSSEWREHVGKVILRQGVLLDSPRSAVLFANALEHVHILRIPELPATALTPALSVDALRCKSLAGAAIVWHQSGFSTMSQRHRPRGWSIDLLPILLTVTSGCLETAVERHWRRNGGQGSAGARRPSPVRSAGGCGRPSQAAVRCFAPECCFFASVVHVCVSVTYFGLACTRTQVSC